MTSSGKPGLVPKLRFPEFRDAGEWEEKRLGDVGKVRMCKRILKEQTSPRGDIPFYKIGTFGGVPDSYISREIFENFRNGYPFPKNGAVLISAAGTIGRTVRYNGELAYFQDSNIVWLDNSEKLITDNFLFYLYQLIDWSPSVGAIQRLYNENILGAQVKFPSTPEQQKIADCLASLDELITLEAQQLVTLKTHKNGLMQQLFPAEGETMPKLRFPEFRDAGEWEEVELGQRINIKGRIGYRGYTVEDIVNSGEGAISLSPSNITGSGSLCFEKATYITWAKYKESPEIMVERNFTLLVKTGSTYGKAAFIRDLPQECTVNPQVVVLKPTSISPYFLFLLVVGDVVQSRVKATVVGGAIPTLSQESISKFKIHVPTLVEQQKIADCLASLDDLITAQTQKLAALKTHKKGLMQQLFPSPEEV